MSTLMKINYKGKPLPMQGNNNDGETLVSLRKFAEAMGHTVKWVDWLPNEIFVDCEPPAKPEPSAPSQSLPLTGQTFIIDAGHGGSDPGAVDGVNAAEMDKINTREDALNFLYAIKLASALKALGAQTVLTRTADQTMTPAERARFAKDKYPNATAFICWHNNSGPSPAKGAEVLYYKTGGSGWKLAAAIVREFTGAGIPLHGTGLVERQDLIVLNSTPMTAVLIEGGFISNPAEEINLHDQGYMERMVMAVVRGIVAIYGKQQPVAAGENEYRKFRHKGADIHVVISRKPNLKVVTAATGSVVSVSEVALQHKAKMAINGGYFWYREPDDTTWPVTPVIVDHKNVGRPGNQVAPRAALCVKDDGAMEIRKALNPDELIGYKNAIGAGPMLVFNGKARVGHDEQFLPDIMDGKKPRAAAGLIDDYTLVQVAVEGRTKDDAGLTLEDLADLLAGLGCRWGMNFDGGGSVWLWLNGKLIVKGRGVVNCLLTL